MSVEPDPLAGRIYRTVEDLVADLLYYDRKEDENLPVGAIDAAIKAGIVTVDKMVEIFRSGLIEGVEE